MASSGVCQVRAASADDAEAIATIYTHHVLHGTATFDTEPPTTEFWAGKIGLLAERGWPFLVADVERGVAGYAYATQFRDRAAYARTCENSIYVSPDMTGRRIGSVLVAALLHSAAASGFREMIAVIGGGEPASIALHLKAGFAHAGRMRNVGLKFGQLLDTVYMQRHLGSPD